MPRTDPDFEKGLTVTQFSRNGLGWRGMKYWNCGRDRGNLEDTELSDSESEFYIRVKGDTAETYTFPFSFRSRAPTLPPC